MPRIKAVRIAIVILLVFALLYGLWSLISSMPDHENSRGPQQAETQASTGSVALTEEGSVSGTEEPAPSTESHPRPPKQADKKPRGIASTASPRTDGLPTKPASPPSSKNSASNDTPIVVIPLEIEITTEVPAEVDEALAIQTEKITEEAATAYVDQYMTDEDWVDDWGVAEGEQPTGRRVTELEYIFYDTDDDIIGSETEHGLRALYRRETMHYGDFEVQALVSDLDTEFAGRSEGTNAVVTLRQIGMPISENYWLNNTLGHQRNLTDTFLHGSYRYRLPTSPLLGYSGEIYNTEQKFNLSVGRTGSYDGIALQQFDDDGGTMAVAAYQQRIGNQWSVGGELISLNGSDEIRDHSSFLGALQYTNLDGSVSHALHMLADDDSNVGLWTDSQHVFSGGPTLRYGAYYLADELVWTDVPVADDQQGIYLRTDKRGRRYNFSLGYDYYETGLESEEFTRSDNHSIFFNGNYRWSRKSTLGLSAVYFDRAFTAAVDDAQTSWRVNGSYHRRLKSGTGRFELFASELDSEIPTNRRDSVGARLSYDWRMPKHVRLTTELTSERETVYTDEVDRNEASLLFRHDLADRLSWGMNFSVYRSKSDLFSSATGTSFSADARWQFLPRWYANLSISRNESAIDGTNVGFFPTQNVARTDSVWLRIGYSRASGLPFRTYGRTNGKAGSGRVEGVIFFDTNRDYVRQAGEPAAVGVVVLLDGRYEARTDNNGRYVFDPVPAGDHRIQVLTEELPLPWGLDDESPQLISVGPRRPAYSDFPLIETN